MFDIVNIIKEKKKVKARGERKSGSREILKINVISQDVEEAAGKKWMINKPMCLSSKGKKFEEKLAQFEESKRSCFV